MKRDNRNPVPSSEITTKVMRANKGKGTKPELLVRRILRDSGYPGYRLNWRGVPGRPDIAYPGRKIAIFVNGCFWHRCPYCNLPLPKTHVEFWEEKFRKNMERDDRNLKRLTEMGWRTLIVWECEVKDIDQLTNRIEEFMSEADSGNY